MRSVRQIAGLVVLVIAVILSGCGSDSGGDSGSTVTVKETETVTEEAPPAEEDPAEPSESNASDAGAGSSSGSGDKITVPDVEGKDHQLAQDTMQAAGLYKLDEEDATGQGRSLILDRNWTVVEQDPPAGSKVSPDTTITLRSKKDDE